MRRPRAEVDWLFALLGLDHVLELVDQPPTGATTAPAIRLEPPDLEPMAFSMP